MIKPIKKIRVLREVIGIPDRLVEVFYEDGTYDSLVIDDPNMTDSEAEQLALRKFDNSNG